MANGGESVRVGMMALWIWPASIVHIHSASHNTQAGRQTVHACVLALKITSHHAAAVTPHGTFAACHPRAHEVLHEWYTFFCMLCLH